MEFVVDLSGSLDSFSARLVGNKAYSLAYARSHRLPVPRSFAFSVRAFEEFLESGFQDLPDLLSQCARNTDLAKETLEAIQGRIMEQPLPPLMAREIREAFSRLDSKYAAVRSSATEEDGDTQSLAGQYDSFLGVAEDKLPESIKACWASLFGIRAYHYLNRRPPSGNMAVLIQEMINADASGVCFSLHPVTGSEDEIVIEAVLGLGELLAQGAVVPDHYRVSRNTLEVVKENSYVGVQEEKIVLDASGGGCVRARIRDEQIQAKQKVPDDKIREIAAYALQAERIYQQPVDVEWALAGDTVYILLVRPVTGF